MLLYEYQAKALFSAKNIEIPRGILLSKNDTQSIKGFRFPVYVKGQMLSGGRGKVGAIARVDKEEDLAATVERIATLKTSTAQSGSARLSVHGVYLEEGQEIVKALYAAIAIDRAIGSPVLIMSALGGMDIEESAGTSPEKILRVPLDIRKDVPAYVCRRAGYFLDAGVSDECMTVFLRALFNVFRDNDAVLAEVNPLGVTADGRLIALDAKISTDDNAMYRHPEWSAFAVQNYEGAAEQEAASFGLSYVKISGGSIGCMVNGAGLAMATMDALSLYGGNAANFLDVGGTATVETTIAAFRILTSDSDVKTILVNIFGGIVKCDLIADAILAACAQVNLSIPLVVRLEGTNSEEALRKLEASGRALTIANGLSDAIQKAVHIAGRS